MQCPKCSNSTLQEKYFEQSNLQLDFCPQCKGLWLDAGELEKITQVCKSLRETDTEQLQQQIHSDKHPLISLLREYNDMILYRF